MQMTYDVWTAETRKDPYPLYRQMRERDPVWWDGGSWVLTRHADVLLALLDPRLSAEFPDPASFLTDEELARFADLYAVTRAFMLFRDEPAHTRLRGLVAQAFSAKMVESMRPRVRRIVDELLDAVAPAGEMDIIRDLANPLPGVVIAEMLGVPQVDQPRFKHWANEYAIYLGAANKDNAVRQRGNDSVVAMTAYIRQAAAERRERPRGDLLTALVQAEEAGEHLSELELAATCFLLLFAGNETTTNLIGNGILTLLRHPDALAQLRAQPELIRTATEEFLRFEGPVQMTGRRVREDVEVGDTLVRAGDSVTTILGAANRDPDQFPDPDRLDITRRPNRHVAFGHGVHFCLGAPLARLEGQIAIDAVVRRFPRLRLACDDIEWQPNDVFRGLTALPVMLA
jgi:cytochrome P450